uniref:ZM domain-containing protein n=1 Tax=Parascaris univalens TaxID=6257 RepID=A0A915BLH6_PARUN
MGLVVVEGVAVPKALALSFADPKKRPFSYSKPLPPSAQPASRPRTFRVPFPRVLPILPPEEQPVPSPSDMPSNIQYNTPMPIYSRETAEEEYRSQFGSGPECPLGTSDKHFDPEKSETLRAIHEGDNTEFGKNFFEKVAQAEAPHIPPTTEPAWTEEARRRAERARSATPSAYSRYDTPTPYHSTHTPSSYQLQRPLSQQSVRSERSVKKGYEFGGLDYVDRSRLSHDTYHYGYNSLPLRGKKEERRTTPGYEMGGMDFRKGGVSVQGQYQGYGPLQPRLVSKYEKSTLKHDEMNIETAPNVNRVSADVLVGDTISNQKISTDTSNDQRYAFGTSFAPISGFKKDYRTVHRNVEPPKAPVFSLSAKKDYVGQGNTGYSSSMAYGRGGGNATSGGIHSYEQRSRSQSAAPAERAQWIDDKEVTIETLLNDRALIPRNRSVTPDWHTHSLDKHNRWSNISDPRLTRSQTFEYEPNWSRTVKERRSAWEAQARNTDARVQMPASSKVPSQQPPYWYNKAKETHRVWQSEADRQAANPERYSATMGTQQNYSSYSSETQRSQRTYDTREGGIERSKTAAYQIEPYHPPSHYESGSYYHHEERHHETQQSGGGGYQTLQPRSSSFSSVQREHYTTENGVPVTQSTFKTYTATPVATEAQQGGTTQSLAQKSAAWQSQQRAPLAVEEYRHARYQMKSHDSTSTERVLNRPFTSGSSEYNVESGGYQYKTQQQPVAPHTVTSTVVTERSGGEFDRKAEMAEVLPRGSVANTQASMEGSYLDREGRNVNYKRELVTSVDPNRECSLLKEEERRVVETPLEPGVISRHVTTKYYKKKTVTDTTTTTTNAKLQ